jgi:protein phosphatase
MQLEAFCQTDVGCRRDSNEDSFLIDESLGLYVVADGMGGHRGGEVASAMAVETVREVIFKASTDKRKLSVRQILTAAYAEASRRIFDRSHNQNPELRGMGTTLVVAYFVEGTLYIGNVGDSRAYLYAESKLWQLTEDHSLLNRQLRAGLLAESDIPNFAAKNVITRSVGFEREVDCDIIERQIQPDDLFLLCSDGLSGMVEDHSIAQICGQGKPQPVVTRCIEQAKKNGGDDNVTVLALRAMR